MHVRVDRDVCAGHARCHAVAPTLFQLDDEGYARALDREMPPAVVESGRAAAAACPEGAIIIEEQP